MILVKVLILIIKWWKIYKYWKDDNLIIHISIYLFIYYVKNGKKQSEGEFYQFNIAYKKYYYSLLEQVKLSNMRNIIIDRNNLKFSNHRYPWFIKVPTIVMTIWNIYIYKDCIICSYFPLYSKGHYMNK